MKRGPIPRRDQALLLTPEQRLSLMEDLKRVEGELLTLKKDLMALSDRTLVVFNECQELRLTLRGLGGRGDG